MPNTKLTKAKWQNHMQYGKIVYIVLALVAIFVADIAFTVTQYRPPNERKVDIELVVSSASTEGFDTIAENALAVGQAFDETLEEVTFINIAYNPDDKSDYYGAQKYMVMLAAQEGDIYILPYSLLEQLAGDGVLVPLEGYIEEGVIDAGDQDLAPMTFYEPVDEEGKASDAQHVYGISCEAWYGMMNEEILIDNRNLYACIMAFSKNQDTTAHVLQSIQSQLIAPKPDWLVEAEEKAAAEEAGAETAPTDTSADAEGAGA